MPDSLIVFMLAVTESPVEFFCVFWFVCFNIDSWALPPKSDSHR